MKANKTSLMHVARKAQEPPLTLKELARRAGVSYTTAWNLENGPEEKVHLDIKRKVAHVLGADVIELFPSVDDEYQQLIGEFYDYLQEHFAHAKKTGEALSLRDAWDMIEHKGIPFIYHHRFRTLMDICPTLDAESRIDVDKILQQMTPRELGNLYHSSSTPEEATKLLNRAAKRLGLRAVELKKRPSKTCEK
jgi:transcriptional regulator with XRE-family HTH domain